MAVHPTRLPLRPLRKLLLACLACGLTFAAARADGLDGYTGFTRPGGPGWKKLTVRGVAAEKNKKHLGGTIYFMVLDRGDGTEGDTFGTGVKDFDTQFTPGVKSNKLDTSARYLYLYQVINDDPDTNNESAVQDATVRLLVDPQHLTSWGAFGKKPEVKDGKVVQKGEGVGFTYTAEDKTGKVIPISSWNRVDPGVPFRDPAPAHVKEGFGEERISVGVAPAAGEKTDYGKVPDAVVILEAAGFENAPRPDLSAAIRRALEMRAVAAGGERAYGTWQAGFDPYAWPYGGYGFGYPVGWPGYPMTRVFPLLAAAYEDEYHTRRDRYPAFRAHFDSPLQYRQRSTLFGFTSNLPPTYEVARLAGNVLPPGAFAADGVVAARPTLAVDGEVPTPIAFGQETAGAVGGIGGFLGGIGGFAPGGGAFGPAGGIGGGFSPAGGLGGGGFPGGGSSGANPNGQAQTQTPTQNQTTPSSTTPTVSVTTGNQSSTNTNQQQQKQRQQQRQQQKQNQHQNNRQNNIVPAPPALLLGLLGAPVFLLLCRGKLGAGKAGAA